MRYFVTIGSRTLDVELGPQGIRVEGEEGPAEMAEVDGTEVRSLLLGHRSHRVVATRLGRGRWSLHLGGRQLLAEVLDERSYTLGRMAGGGKKGKGPGDLRAPMPGLVVKVEAEEGDTVVPGQGLVVVEAMKMENELKCEAPGRVKRVLVSAGDAVEKGQLLVELEPLQGEEEGRDLRRRKREQAG